MSPILVRPVREQLEHDRVIRLLQAKYKRKFEVAINPGNEQAAAVGAPTSPWYPDLVLQSGKRLSGVVEVETSESLNHLEAMSQWVAFGKLRVPFHLYVPASGIDSARRLCADMQIPIAEMWAYHAIGEQIRFTLVSRIASAAPAVERPREHPAPAPKARATRSAAAKPAAKSAPAKTAASKPRRGASSSTKPKAAAAKKKSAGARKAAAKRPVRAAASAKPPKRK